MTKPKHTPGPWRQTDRMSGGEIWIQSKDGHIARIKTAVGSNRSFNEEKADAALIAAAPELLEALEVLVAHAPNSESEAQVRALIAKARGES